MRKIYLLSPPLYFAPAPLLAAPLLHGFLKSRHLAAATADLNIRFLHWLKNEDAWLSSLSDRMIAYYNQLQTRTAVDGPEAALRSELAQSLGLLPKNKLQAGINGTVVRGDPYADATDEWPQQTIKLMHVLKLLFPFLLGGASSGIQKTMNTQGEYLNALDRFFKAPQTDALLREAAAADIAGISVAFSGQQLFSAVLLARRIKELRRDCFVILGGSGLSMLAAAEKDQLLASEAGIDAIGLYDGARSLAELAQGPAGRPADPGRVPNLLYREPRSGTVRGTPEQPPPDPDEWATPVFDDREVRLYHELARPWFKEVRLPVFVADGCYWGKCAFCADHLTRGPQTHAPKPRSADRVAADLHTLQQEYGADYFYLITSALIPQWTRRLSERLIRDGRTVSLWGYLRAGSERVLHQSFFDTLKRAGFEMITVGVESTVDRVLAAVQKGNTQQEIRHTLRGLKQAGIKTKFNLIADLPPTSPAESSINERFINEHIDLIDDLTVFRFVLYRGSAMAENPEAYGIRLRKNSAGMPLQSSQLTLQFDNPAMEGSEAEQGIGRIEKMGQDLQFRQWTRTLRERVDAAGFDWQTSRLVFRSFIAVETVSSREGSRAAQEGSDQRLTIHLDHFFQIAELPGTFAAFVAVMADGVRAPVAFATLQEAFQEGWRCSGVTAPEAAPVVLEALLRRFIEKGFVEEVLTEFCSATPYRSAITNERLTALGFRFRTPPWACVPTLKMG